MTTKRLFSLAFGWGLLLGLFATPIVGMAVASTRDDLPTQEIAPTEDHEPIVVEVISDIPTFEE